LEAELRATSPADFALIIRAISVLEGVALVGDPNFAIVDEAYPFIAKLLLTDQSPRLQASLRYMVSFWIFRLSNGFYHNCVQSTVLEVKSLHILKILSL
jgi:predicted unusual protein kinase regulating ubiquinone biosynthesis (AarF/ABC1/UbiB family)